MKINLFQLILALNFPLLSTSTTHESNDASSFANYLRVASDSEDQSASSGINDNQSTRSRRQNEVPSTENDLGLRFNKFPFPIEPGSLTSGGSIPRSLKSVLPIRAEDLPMDDNLSELLRNETWAHSIILTTDYECRGDNRSEWMEKLGRYPPFPSADREAPFWDEFRTVVNVQIDRRCNKTATTYIKRLPDLWEGYSLPDAAEAVHSPVLGRHHINLFIQMNQEGLQLDEDILPSRGNRDFIGREVRLNELLNWAIGNVAPLNFMIKWTVAMPRPEEVAWKVATGEWRDVDGIPQDISQSIRYLNLKSPEEFTAFPEGCPPHPSWPAMHAASSSVSLWLPVVAKLSPKQYCEVLRLDYAYAFGRTAAGVHYPMDNLSGLNFAQEYIASKLPGHLSERYGSNKTAVEEKMANYRFDWSTFDPVDCSYAAKATI